MEDNFSEVADFATQVSVILFVCSFVPASEPAANFRMNGESALTPVDIDVNLKINMIVVDYYGVNIMSSLILVLIDIV